MGSSRPWVQHNARSSGWLTGRPSGSVLSASPLDYWLALWLGVPWCRSWWMAQPILPTPGLVWRSIRWSSLAPPPLPCWPFLSASASRPKSPERFRPLRPSATRKTTRQHSEAARSRTRSPPTARSSTSWLWLTWAATANEPCWSSCPWH